MTDAVGNLASRRCSICCDLWMNDFPSLELKVAPRGQKANTD